MIEALVLLLSVPAGYLLTCKIWPYTACPRCKGRGTFNHGKSFRNCRRCGGSGRRRRVGAWLMDRRRERRSR